MQWIGGGVMDYPRYSLTLTLFVAGTAGRGWDTVVQTMVGGNTVVKEGERRKGKKKGPLRDLEID